MTDRPILFSAPMVRALLDGRKTQTRRLLKVLNSSMLAAAETDGGACLLQFSRFAVGDRLWVREAWRADDYDTTATIYRADMPADVLADTKGIVKWRPPIHMFRVRSRLTLTVTEVRAQKLQAISAADTISEGVQCPTCEAMRQSACYGLGCFASLKAFEQIWEEINGAWEADPWIIALTFTVDKRNIDA